MLFEYKYERFFQIASVGNNVVLLLLGLHYDHIQQYYPNNFNRFMVLPTTTKALGNGHYYSTEHCCMYRYGSLSGLAVYP